MRDVVSLAEHKGWKQGSTASLNLSEAKTVLLPTLLKRLHFFLQPVHKEKCKNDSLWF